MKLSELIRRLMKLQELRGNVFVYRCQGDIFDLPMFRISSQPRTFGAEWVLGDHVQEYAETLVYEDMDSDKSWEDLELPQ